MTSEQNGLLGTSESGGAPGLWKWVQSLRANSATTVPAVPLWYVRWWGRRGSFSSDTFPCVEAFPTRAEAEAFATALRDAMRVVRLTGEKTTVTVDGGTR